MDWNAAIDNYCERLGPEFWAEPLNAVTNAAFVVAALVALRVALRRRSLDWPLAVLVAITLAVGVGSFLFHTVATRWAAFADIVPIQLFILTYFALAMRRFVGIAWWAAGAATVGFIVFSVAGGALLDRAGVSLNGSEGYLPPLAALLLVGVALVLSGRRGPGGALIVAAAIFAVSLTFRTVDMAVCAALPIGTHFLWHTLNGLLLGYLLIAMVRFGRPQAAGAARAMPR
ncbi:ceramidase domain-containing protein [Acuticoccus mangrovi]|uniref:ceramidase domain-containing protein n=1 Tax=Acuticoccus mangrovi TaxID=2796142 RepID=UPI002FCBD9E9